MCIENTLKSLVSIAIKNLYQTEIGAAEIVVNKTNPDFEGDYTVVLFSLTKLLRKPLPELANELGEYLIKENEALLSKFNFIKGFLNITVTEKYLANFLSNNVANKNFGLQQKNNKKVMVEYASPNTNKPLHLGHLRNIFLGWSMAEIFKANGYTVFKSSIANNRGIHICKSMVAWKLYGKGITPDEAKIKGDHLVGDYYVMFGKKHQEEIAELMKKGMTKEEATDKAPIMQSARKMLLAWEQGDDEVMKIWKMMNAWVFSGFDETYKTIGCDFDKTYLESNTYLLGKKAVETGINKKIFFQKPDNSIWIDLTDDGMDEKIVQRSDGTSVYITQDIGLAQLRQEEFDCEKTIYVVGDEQNYHFKVLKIICEKLAIPGAEGIHHLSYGMVELPSGRMKTREGTVVDADDIVKEMINVAAQKTTELGKVADFDEDELKKLYATLGIGALKFFLLRVGSQKRILFNPEESIEFQGFTGPFVQYTHARIKSILRKQNAPENFVTTSPIEKLEKNLLLHIERFPLVLQQAADDFDPSCIAIYAFELAKLFNSFYTEHSVLSAETEEKIKFRLQLCALTANTIAQAMHLLGINVPEKM